MLTTSPRRWRTAAVALVENAENRVLLLPLTEPLRQPTVLSGSGGLLWKFVAEAGEGGVSVDALLRTVDRDAEDIAPSDADAMARDIEAFLDDLVTLGLLVDMTD